MYFPGRLPRTAPSPLDPQDPYAPPPVGTDPYAPPPAMNTGPLPLPPPLVPRMPMPPSDIQNPPPPVGLLPPSLSLPRETITPVLSNPVTNPLTNAVNSYPTNSPALPRPPAPSPPSNLVSGVNAGRQMPAPQPVGSGRGVMGIAPGGPLSGFRRPVRPAGYGKYRG